MPTTSLFSSSLCVDQMYPFIVQTPTNRSLRANTNIVGLNGAFPSISSPPLNTGNYGLDQFSGLNNVPFSFRTLQSLTTTSAAKPNCNQQIVTHNGNYKVMSYTSSSTKVFKNGALAGTISTARGTLSLASLVVGDIIEYNHPAILYHQTNPGLIGAYCGYAGYTFANRIDRYTVTIYIFNVSGVESNYEIGYSSTSNSNLTSLTSVQSGTINSTVGSYVSYTTATIGNYFISTDNLSVVWRGQAPSSDCMTVYPMTAETKYGWFSGNGHVLATNNSECQRTSTGGGNTITGRATDNGSANIISSLGTGEANAYSCDSLSSTLRGGNYFSGDGCVVYNSSTTPTATGTNSIFSAESQADGNGGEMTAFTGISAHARGAVSPGGAAWVAVITAGFSGSTATLGNYTDVVMRFNSSGIFQNAKSFTGQNSSNPQSSKAYWGNGSGTGTEFGIGDFLWSTVRVQGFHDTDASDKDETNLLMSDSITLPSPTAYTISEAKFESAEDACTEGPEYEQFEVYSPSTFPQAGMVMFSTSNSTYNTPYNAQNLYHYMTVGRSNYYVRIDYNGIVTDFGSC